jgi:hypothetical protein
VIVSLRAALGPPPRPRGQPLQRRMPVLPQVNGARACDTHRPTWPPCRVAPQGGPSLLPEGQRMCYQAGQDYAARYINAATCATGARKV